MEPASNGAGLEGSGGPLVRTARPAPSICSARCVKHVLWQHLDKDCCAMAAAELVQSGRASADAARTGDVKRAWQPDAQFAAVTLEQLYREPVLSGAPFIRAGAPWPFHRFDRPARLTRGASAPAVGWRGHTRACLHAAVRSERHETRHLTLVCLVPPTGTAALVATALPRSISSLQRSAGCGATGSLRSCPSWPIC